MLIAYLISMGQVKITVESFKCERCEHDWVTCNKKGYPNVCPKCKSPYLDKPRKKGKKEL